jgi:ubiquitin carboxyl-terminal hydrolase L3
LRQSILNHGNDFNHNMASVSTYKKHFIPLESNPEVFTELIQDLGLSKLSFEDVYTLDEPDFLPHPAHALILVFPTTEIYEADKQKEEKDAVADREGTIWFKQTINNACGLYAILHAVYNSGARSYIGESQDPTVKPLTTQNLNHFWASVFQIQTP